MNRTPSTMMGKTLVHDLVPTDNTLLYSAAIDCVQHDGGHAVFDVFSGAAGSAVDIDSIAVYECDTSGGSYTAVTDATFTAITTANDGVLQTGSVQLRARQRYLKIAYNPGAANSGDFNCIVTLIGASESKQNADTYAFEV